MPGLPRTRVIRVEPIVKRPPAPSRRLTYLLLSVLSLALLACCAALASRLDQMDRQIAVSLV